MSDHRLKILVLGAHPDDAEYHAGGLLSIYRSLGHTVKMISLTNGDAGHHEIAGEELAKIRRAEAAEAGQVIGAEYVTWDNHDGQLQPTLQLREQIIAEIRTFQPDLVLTHRPCDYHPDHRAVGQAVQDASYMVIVPSVVTEVPALRVDPVVMYMPDRFTKPTRLSGDIVIDVTEHVDTIVRMMACHRSQFFGWLAYAEGVLDEIPEKTEQRYQWLNQRYRQHLRPMADLYRKEIIDVYGQQQKIEYVEVYEVSEYAGKFDDEQKKRLFPFLP